MIVLDTNGMSEAVKPDPSRAVMRWLAAQTNAALFTTAITQAEILYGIELLPIGRRHAGLSNAIEQLFANYFSGRILPFDEIAAHAYPVIFASRYAMGRPVSQFDAMIAAIARSRNAAVATRDVSGFDSCGLKLINPWDE